MIKNEQGDVIELHCSYDPATLGANPEGRKVKGVIHWVSATHGLTAEVRVYDRLFNHPAPDAAKDGQEYTAHLNPESMLTLTHCVLEPALADANEADVFQFEREGYFCKDPAKTADGLSIFNRTVSLRDSWAKIEKQEA